MRLMAEQVCAGCVVDSSTMPPFEASGGEYDEKAEIAELFKEPVSWMEEATLTNLANICLSTCSS